MNNAIFSKGNNFEISFFVLILSWIQTASLLVKEAMYELILYKYINGKLTEPVS